MFKQALVDRYGKPLALRGELGRGGEGVVFEIEGQNDLVAKIYFNLPDQDKSNKLLAMINSGNERLLKLATWPRGSIHTPSGKFVGYTMQKLQGYRPLFELYSPKLRIQEFPRADWRFLIHAAMNVARAFSVIHEAGHVIGDVNHGNLLVAEDSTVKFIDTDSFQVFDKGNYWLCEVGVATHQPPEMQGRATYKGLVRTPNHDNFGLAEMIFQLLCLARHPFSGRYLGAGEMPIEKAIAEFRFAYALDRNTTQMLPPPGSVTANALSPKIRQFFEQAFSRNGVTGVRPTSKEWISALEELLAKLKVCHINLGHHYLSSLTVCPWCEIEAKNNFVVFPVIAQNAQVTFNVTALWKQLLELREVRPEPALPERTSIHISLSEEAKTIRTKLNARKIKECFFCGGIAFITCLVIPSFAPFVLPATLFWRYLAFKKIKAQLTSKVVQHLEIAKTNWDAFCINWKARVDGTSFNMAKQKLQSLKQKYDSLPQERQYHLRNLWSHHTQQQLIQHLDRYRIATACLDGFGPGRISTLQSYGIETAGDIDEKRLMILSGFGEKLIGRLLDWRRQCESLFTFDPAQTNTQSIIAGIDRDMAIKRHKIEQELLAGAAKLVELRVQVEKNRQQALNEASNLLQAHAQAAIDSRAVGVCI